MKFPKCPLVPVTLERVGLLDGQEQALELGAGSLPLTSPLSLPSPQFHTASQCGGSTEQGLQGPDTDQVRSRCTKHRAKFRCWFLYFFVVLIFFFFLQLV